MLGWLKKKKKREEAPSVEIDPEKKVVLFVCTANLSRSPMAEAMFRALVAEDPRYAVLSAGTKSVNGYAPTPEALTVLQVNHYDTEGLVTAHLEKWMLQRADFVFVMSDVHFKSVCELWPGVAGKCYLITDFEEDERDRGNDVPDPHEKPLRAYLEVYEMLDRLMPRLLEFVENGPSEEWLSWYRFYRHSSLALGG